MMDMRKEDNIQNYLDGQLHGEELKLFETEMLRNKELAREVAALKEVELELRASDYSDLKKNVQAWESEYQSRKRRLMYVYMAMAASITLLVVAYITWLRDKPISTQDLFAQYFRPYEDLVLERGDQANEHHSVFLQGMSAYNHENYEQAVVLLNNYALESDEPDSLIYLYLGISQMMTEDYSGAEASFKQAIRVMRLRQQAEWYLSLMYVRSNELRAAQQVLEEIIHSPNHYRQREAERLLKHLK